VDWKEDFTPRSKPADESRPRGKGKERASYGGDAVAGPSSASRAGDVAMGGEGGGESLSGKGKKAGNGAKGR